VALVVRDHAVISAFSAASVAFVVLFAGVIFLMAVASAAPAAIATAATAAAVAPMTTWDPAGLLVALPVMAYSFTGHPYYLGIYEMLSGPSVMRMNAVTDQVGGLGLRWFRSCWVVDAGWLTCSSPPAPSLHPPILKPTHILTPDPTPKALSITAVVYWIVGICAYATFRQRTAGDVLRNFGGADARGARGAYQRATKACFGLAVLGSIPLAIIPFYTILQPLLQRGNGGGGGARKGGGGSSFKARQSNDEVGAAAAGGGGGGGKSGGAVARTSALVRGGKDSAALSDEEGEQLPIRGGGHGGHGGSGSSGASGAVAAVAPAVAQIIDPQFDPHVSVHDAEVALSFPQHALLTCLLLGTGMAAALWLPNLEFIFGLTGATTSVVISYIMPALCFLKLAGPDPEVTFGAFGGAGGAGGAAPKNAPGGGGGGKPGLLAPPELRASWSWRRRVARALLVFGVAAGVLCTHAILSSIQEEKAVVQLAQELVAHEVVVAEAAHAQIKAKEAAAAISAVQDAAQHLGSMRRTANQTLGALEAAAAALSAVANASAAADGRAAVAGAAPHALWDIQGRIAEHKQKAAEDRTLGRCEDSGGGCVLAFVELLLPSPLPQ
jgi:amino acid permease